jgi:hypothetical protein
MTGPCVNAWFSGAQNLAGNTLPCQSAVSAEYGCAMAESSAVAGPTAREWRGNAFSSATDLGCDARAIEFAAFCHANYHVWPTRSREVNHDSLAGIQYRSESDINKKLRKLSVRSDGIQYEDETIKLKVDDLES